MTHNEIRVEVSLFKGILTALLAIIIAIGLTVVCVHMYFDWQFTRLADEIAGLKRTQAAYHGIQLKAIENEKSSPRTDSSP